MQSPAGCSAFSWSHQRSHSGCHLYRPLSMRHSVKQAVALPSLHREMSLECFLQGIVNIDSRIHDDSRDKIQAEVHFIRIQLPDSHESDGFAIALRPLLLEHPFRGRSSSRGSKSSRSRRFIICVIVSKLDEDFFTLGFARMCCEHQSQADFVNQCPYIFCR